jgi:glycosyltransferase involved in cell wall biosynthesis
MISVAIITRNESPNIEACIRSVAWAQEVIVLDQFSSDGTAEKASALGARVFQEEWKGFAGQKMSAIKKTHGDWILSLDADERVSPELKVEIEKSIREKDAMNGYFIPRRNYFAGSWIRHGGWYPDYCLRLFRKGLGRFEERAVHEKLTVPDPLGYLRSPLEHYTYRSVGDFLVRMERYSRLAAVEISGKKRLWPFSALLFRPPFTFLGMYVLRGGFLDGRKGFFLAVSYSYYTFLKYYRSFERDLDAPD